MAQYLEIKTAHPEALLFYRMGDFYEMFFDDAVAAATALDIALTKRGQHLGQDIPMCGVPVHAAEGYLLTLIRKGFRVAIAEQMEDPSEAKKRGSKAVVARAVVRLVTPGTLTEEALLDARRHNFLAAWSELRGEAALAWADISTGLFHVSACPASQLGAELARLAPRELLVTTEQAEALRGAAEEAGTVLTPLARSSFDSASGEARLCALFRVATLDGFGSFGRAELSAMGALAAYLELTQKGRLPLLKPPSAERAGASMLIDAATRRNLEIAEALSGGREGSLVAAVDRTLTAAGGRLLERRLAAPSLDLSEISARHDAVAHLVEARALAEALRAALRQVPDMDRALARIALDRGRPRDLATIRNGLAQARQIAGLLDAPPPGALTEARAALLGQEALLALLDTALDPEPPLLLRDGGTIAAGFDAELDAVRRLRDEGRGVIAAMQADLAQAAGITALKIRHNNVLGYFVEVPARHAERMLAAPLSETFIHRQTTANALRFTTLDLAQLETRMLNAGARALEIERRIFADLRAAVLAAAGPLGSAAAGLAEVDVAAALAEVAVEGGWCRPRIDGSDAFEVEAGRHPVVERALRREGAPFVANDCRLGGAAPRIRLLTGPNMAGKSTYLRQNALIALLAQAGSFVPAERAHIGLVSQLFSRVGAADDLARGRSTFMVEMVETAAILNRADARALVILDEIGRGTATWDGLSIAWAVLEHLHEVNRCRALFATHYHELTGLAGRLPGLANATVAVREWEGEVVFLHEVAEGAADRSYGVQVARLAGLPPSVVARARMILAELEQGPGAGGRGATADLMGELPLFSAAAARPAPPGPPAGAAAVAARVAEVEPDGLTPRAALDLVYELQRLLRG